MKKLSLFLAIAMLITLSSCVSAEKTVEDRVDGLAKTISAVAVDEPMTSSFILEAHYEGASKVLTLNNLVSTFLDILMYKTEADFEDYMCRVQFSTTSTKDGDMSFKIQLPTSESMEEETTWETVLELIYVDEVFYLNISSLRGVLSELASSDPTGSVEYLRGLLTEDYLRVSLSEVKELVGEGIPSEFTFESESLEFEELTARFKELYFDEELIGLFKRILIALLSGAEDALTKTDDTYILRFDNSNVIPMVQSAITFLSENREEVARAVSRIAGAFEQSISELEIRNKIDKMVENMPQEVPEELGEFSIKLAAASHKEGTFSTSLAFNLFDQTVQKQITMVVCVGLSKGGGTVEAPVNSYSLLQLLQDVGLPVG